MGCFQHKLQVSAQEICATDKFFIDKQRKRNTWTFGTGDSCQRENTHIWLTPHRSNLSRNMKYFS